MGVTTIHGYPLPDGKTGPQAAESLCRTLEKLGGVRIGTFHVECETFFSTPNVMGMTPARALHLFHDSDHPASCFSLLDTGTCLVSDSNFDGLLTNISAFYLSKKSTKIESRGPKYQIGDFTVKVGSAAIGPSFRGILIEVEYGPCVVPANCWELMKEFMGSFMSPPRDPHHYLQSKMNDIFSPIDTIHQYADHFNILKKQVGSAASFVNAFHQNAGSNVSSHQTSAPVK
jgi:mediator of RNA polymerase II transcription subunit 20